MIKSNTDEALLQVNNIPYGLVEEIRLEGETITCQLKESERACCLLCGVPSSSIKNRYKRTLIGRGIENFKFEIKMTTVHFRCKNEDCQRKTFAPNLKIAQGKSPFLPSFREYLAKEHFLAKRNNHEVLRDVNGRHRIDISESTLQRIQNQTEQKPLNLTPRIIGLDEMYPKGQRKAYLTVHDLDSGILLGAAEGIRQADFERLFDGIKLKGVSLGKVSFVIRDLYPHWDRKLKERLKERITIIADPFHIVKRVQSLLYQNYYAPLRKRFQTEGETKKSAELFKARWAFKKASEKLTEKQKERLTLILNQYQILDKIWILKERVREIYKAENRSKAREKLAWCIRYAEENGFWEIYKLLKRNQLSILNIFEDCCGQRRKINHYPEERISQLRRIERKRGCFRKIETFVRNIQIGYQMEGLI